MLLIETVVRGTYMAPEGIAGLLAGSVPAPLATTLANLCFAQQASWKGEAIKHTVSVPKLVGVDWRVDVKTASTHASGLGVPSVVMKLVVDEKTVVFEMDKETLQAMLSGLGKIRDQLDRISQ
jgi:hypothetical protein